MCTVPHQNHWLQAHVGSIVHSFCRCRGWSSFTGICAAQESANPPAEKEAFFMHDNLISQRWVPTCCPCTVSPSAGYRLCGTWQKDDPIGGGHDTNTSRSVSLDLTLALFVLPCIFPQSQFFMPLLHFSSRLLLCLESPLVMWLNMVDCWFMQTLKF